ncbi:hypothetical protein EDD11_001280 [Mortierella claussenii]|nr:hypothetical protein EDD11_001280 [Mortierella claussenii]
MDNKQSGMVTPPIVSPRPIQTQKPLTADESWKIVGSPPRRPLLSPPEERERNRVLQDSDTTTVEGNRTKIIAATRGSDLVDLADSNIASISAGVGNESFSASSASSTSTPASPTTPQHKQTHYHTAANQSLGTEPLPYPMAPGVRRSGGPSPRKSMSPFDQEPIAEEPALQSMHYKSSSTGTLSSRHQESAPFAVLGHRDIGLDESYHSKSHSLNGLGLNAGVTRTGQKQNGSGLEPPLNLNALIWSGRPSEDPSGVSAPGNDSINSSNGGVSRLDAIGPGIARTGRSLSFSDSSFSSAFGLGSTKLALDQDDEDVLRYRPPLPIMEEEAEDALEPRFNRARSYSTSAALGSSAFLTSLSSAMFSGQTHQDPFGMTNASFSGSGLMMGDDNQPPLHRRPSGGLSAWPNSAMGETPAPNHRRSVTSASSYHAPIWESPGPFQTLPLPAERDRRVERQRVARRFSLAPSSGFQTYDSFLDDVDAGNSSSMNTFSRHPADSDLAQQAQRRHSVAGLGGTYARPNITPYSLTSSLEALQLNDGPEQSNAWNLHEDLYEEDEYQAHGSNTKDLGKGLSLGQLPNCGSLYMVEFKAGRNDLFYIAENSGVSLKVGDLVIVEADRGKDLGKITNDSITPQQIQAMQTQQAEMAAMQLQQDSNGSGSGGSNSGGGHRAPKEIHPKRIFRLAQPSEVSQLVNKNQDEIKAMMVCQTKVRQKRLPMEVVDAEYQWDRRKLTFYFIAERRIDFRELVRDLFKIYKTRIWMYAVSPSMAQASAAALRSSSPPPTLSQQPQQQQQQQGSSVTVPSAEHHPSPISSVSGYHYSQLSQQQQQPYPPQHVTQHYAQYPLYPHEQHHLQPSQHHAVMSAHHRSPQPFYSVPAPPQQQQRAHQQQQFHSYSYPSSNQ